MFCSKSIPVWINTLPRDNRSKLILIMLFQATYTCQHLMSDDLMAGMLTGPPTMSATCALVSTKDVVSGDT